MITEAFVPAPIGQQARNGGQERQIPGVDRSTGKQDRTIALCCDAVSAIEPDSAPRSRLEQNDATVAEGRIERVPALRHSSESQTRRPYDPA